MRNPDPAHLQAARPLGQSQEKRRLLVHLFTAACDGILIVMSFLLAAALYLGEFPARVAVNTATVFLAVYAVLAIYNNVYSLESLMRMRTGIGRVVRTMVLTIALVVFLTFYMDVTGRISRVIMALGVITATGLMVLLRDIVQRALVVRVLPNVRSVLIIRDGGPELKIRDAVTMDVRTEDVDVDPTDPKSLDRFGLLTDTVDRVVVSCPVEKRAKWAFVMRAAGVNGELVSHALRELRPIGLRRDGDFISFIVSTRPLGLPQRFIKRMMDVAIAGGALLVISPVLALTALAIKLEDRGPVFFVQERMGRGNKLFNMLKFRSMKVANLDFTASRQVAKGGDDRVTRVGHFIRRTSIDELPQLLNVLKGDMSMVGPRPHALGALAGDKLYWQVAEEYWHRHSLKPGLTGLAQIRGFRGATEEEHHLSDRLAADLEYIGTWSPWNDIWIMLMTARVLVHDRAF